LVHSVAAYATVTLKDPELRIRSPEDKGEGLMYHI
jgi:hypothetical protein